MPGHPLWRLEDNPAKQLSSMRKWTAGGQWCKRQTFQTGYSRAATASVARNFWCLKGDVQIFSGEFKNRASTSPSYDRVGCSRALRLLGRGLPARPRNDFADRQSPGKLGSRHWVTRSMRGGGGGWGGGGGGGVESVDRRTMRGVECGGCEIWILCVVSGVGYV